MSSDELKQFKEIDYEAINKRFLELLDRADDDAKKLLIEVFMQYMHSTNGENSSNHKHLRDSIDDLAKKIDAYIVRSEPVIKTFENLNWVKKALIYVAAIVAAVVTIGAGIPKLFHDILGK